MMHSRCGSPWAALCPTLWQPLPRGVLWSAGILPAPGVGGRKNGTDTKNQGAGGTPALHKNGRRAGEFQQREAGIPCTPERRCSKKA